MPNCTVVAPDALDVLDGPGAQLAGPHRLARRRRVDLDPARARARQGDLVGGVRQRVGGRGARRRGGRWPRTGSAGSWAWAGSSAWAGSWAWPWSCVPAPARRSGGWSSSRRGCAVCDLWLPMRAEPRPPPRRPRSPPSTPVPRSAPVVHRVEGHALGPVGSGPASSARRRRAGPGRPAGRRRRRWGRQGRGTRRCPAPAPGGPPARSPPPDWPGGHHPDRSHGRRPDPLRQVLERAECVVVVRGPSGRRHPGVAGRRRPRRPPPPAPRPRARRSTSGLFNPETPPEGERGSGRRPLVRRRPGDVASSLVGRRSDGGDRGHASVDRQVGPGDERGLRRLSRNRIGRAISSGVDDPPQRASAPRSARGIPGVRRPARASGWPPHPGRRR